MAVESSKLKAAAGMRGPSWMAPFDTEGRQGRPRMRKPLWYHLPASPFRRKHVVNGRWGRGCTGITGTRNKRLKLLVFG